MTLTEVNNTGDDISFSIRSSGGSATAGDDYAAFPTGVITVANGASTGSFSVSVTDDTDFENDETLIATITNPSDPAVTINTASATATITDNDNAAGTIGAALSATSGAEGGADITYTVTLTEVNNTGDDISFSIRSSGGSATAGDDYAAFPTGVITVANGASTGSFSVSVTDDTDFENDETLIATITNPSDPAVTINTASATATITDNDNAAGTIGAALSATSGAEGGADITYTVTLTEVNNTGDDISFSIRSSGGSATAGDDYAAFPTGVITVANGASTGSFSVSVTDDTDFENDETLIATITNPSDPAVTINTASATATITDNDLSTPILRLNADTGTSDSDHITHDATVNVTNLAVGATWEYSLNGGDFITGGIATSENASFELPSAALDSSGADISVSTIGGQTSLQTLGFDQTLPALFYFDITLPDTFDGASHVLFETGDFVTGTTIYHTDGDLSISIGTGNEVDLTANNVFSVGGRYSVMVEISADGTLVFYVGQANEAGLASMVAEFTGNIIEGPISDFSGSGSGGWGMVSGGTQGDANVTYSDFTGTFTQGLFWSGQTRDMVLTRDFVGDVVVRQSLNAETSANSNILNVTLDTLAPSRPAINVVSMDDLINAAENSAGFNLTGTGEAGATINVSGFESGIADKTTTVASDGTWSIALVDADLADNASTTLSATQTDAAGNSSAASMRTITTDLVAPRFAAPASFGAEQVISSAQDGAHSVTTADVDGDGDVDVLSASSNDDTIAWFANDGSGNFGVEQVISSMQMDAHSVTTADVDGDGDLDVLSASADDNTIAWFENDGLGNFGLAQVISSTQNDASSVTTADVDGDGDLDVLSTSFSDNTIAWFENDGSGNFSAAQVISNK